jgi:hypothetical protein
MSAEETSEGAPSIRIPRSKIAFEGPHSKRRAQGLKPGFYAEKYYMDDSNNADIKFLVEDNLLSFNSALAADPRYFLESSNLSVYKRLNRLVGRLESPNLTHEREYGLFPPRLASLEI